jgi:signal transduction histidine kinase
VGRGFYHPSTRVIALGRLLLATLFLLAIWIDVSQPANAPAATYTLLGTYVAFAAAMVAATWNNWWLDAKAAGTAHALDILWFTALVYLTDGYTSPFFIFFVFLLLAAAIRWGWRETALTAILVTILYLVAGLLAVNSGSDFQLYRFVIRTAQLVIVSLILIWFGANQWRARFPLRVDDLLAEPSLDKSPLETGLQAAMKSVGAARGALVWREHDRKQVLAFTIRDGRRTDIALKRATAPEPVTRAFLYDPAKGRGLTRDHERNLRALDPIAAIGEGMASVLGLKEGLALPLLLDKGDGLLFLERVPNLSTDHIDLGEQIAAEVSAHIQRHALLKAAKDNAEARSRLVLARDLHDSVVQFLAGAAFRLEAMKRSEAAGRPLEPELIELKQLMLQEQGELRSFITGLRSGPEVTLRDLARDLHALAERLSKQWTIECTFTGDESDMAIPTRVHLDAHQLVREAVANAVRHAGAKHVRIALDAGADSLRIDLVNDGAEFPRYGDTIEPPQSLRERVDEAGGEVEVARGMDVTKLSIMLPVRMGSGA